MRSDLLLGGSSKTEGAALKGRYAIPFFSEPGLGCLIKKKFDGGEIMYGRPRDDGSGD